MKIEPRKPIEIITSFKIAIFMCLKLIYPPKYHANVLCTPLLVQCAELCDILPLTAHSLEVGEFSAIFILFTVSKPKKSAFE